MNCIVCGSNVEIKESEKNKNTFAFCNVCKFVEKANKVDESLEIDEYDRHNNSMENDGYVKYLQGFLDEAVFPFIDDGIHLDYGCGPGPVLHELVKRQGFISKRYDYYYEHDSDYMDYKYDVITSTEVFEHFYNPIENIEKILKLLKKGGLLSVMTSFVKPEPEFYDWWYIRDITHVGFYHEKTFEYIAKKYNLEIIYTNNINIMVMKKL